MSQIENEINMLRDRLNGLEEQKRIETEKRELFHDSERRWTAQRLIHSITDVPADGCVPLLITHEKLALHAAPLVDKFGVSSEFTIEQLDLYWRDAVVVAEERSHVPSCQAFLDIALTLPGVTNSYICAVTVATTPWIPEEPEKREIVPEKESVEQSAPEKESEQSASQIKSAEGGGGSCYPSFSLEGMGMDMFTAEGLKFLLASLGRPTTGSKKELWERLF